ncbi:MAG TPA: response regulator, partial [Polyangiaceae bacterium]|nr:response regulator [Polyangiaceae bacterium]
APKIVIVDDDRLILRAASRLLEIGGITCVRFEDGAAAIDYIEREGDGISLVWTDFDLNQRVSGIDVLNATTRRSPAPLALLVTASTDLPTTPTGTILRDKSDIREVIAFVRDLVAPGSRA